MRLILIQQFPTGRRVWIGGQRCHHGAVGALAIAVGLWAHSPATILAGALLSAHDAHDIRIWFRREGRPHGIR